MAYVVIGNKRLSVKKGKDDKYYYMKDGKKVYTRKRINKGSPKKGKKSIRSTRKPKGVKRVRKGSAKRKSSKKRSGSKKKSGSKRRVKKEAILPKYKWLAGFFHKIQPKIQITNSALRSVYKYSVKIGTVIAKHVCSSREDGINSFISKNFSNYEGLKDVVVSGVSMVHSELKKLPTGICEEIISSLPRVSNPLWSEEDEHVKKTWKCKMRDSKPFCTLIAYVIARIFEKAERNSRGKVDVFSIARAIKRDGELYRLVKKLGKEDREIIEQVRGEDEEAGDMEDAGDVGGDEEDDSHRYVNPPDGYVPLAGFW